MTSSIELTDIHQNVSVPDCDPSDVNNTEIECEIAETTIWAHESFLERFKQISVRTLLSVDSSTFPREVLRLWCVPVDGFEFASRIFLLTLSNITSLAMIGIAVRYFHQRDCPIAHLSWLLLIGGIIALILSTLMAFKNEGAKVQSIFSIVALASIFWGILASVMTFGVYYRVTFDENKTEDRNYCNPVLYTFLFCAVTTFVLWMIVCFVIVGASFLLALHFVRVARNEQNINN